MSKHKKFMIETLALAEAGAGHASPNPCVGAVVVKGGRIIGRGYHARCGLAHAEPVALADAGSAAKGADLYVTLEPCHHHGKQPPCTEAVIKAGIKRLIYATADSNKLSGTGFAALRKAGIEIVGPICEDEAQALNADFFKVMTTGLPYVISKWAMSLDGHTATRRGDAAWISCEASRQLGHRYRALCDAILVGSGTLAQDDPSLSCRLAKTSTAKLKKMQPTRLVLDTHLTIRPSATLIKAGGPPLVIFVAPATFEGKKTKIKRLLAHGHVRVVPIATDRRGQLNLKKVLQWCAKSGLHSVLAEGGACLHGSLFDGGLVDEVLVFVAPTIIGGAAAVPAVAGQGIGLMSQAGALVKAQWQSTGRDQCLNGYIHEGPSAWQWALSRRIIENSLKMV